MASKRITRKRDQLEYLILHWVNTRINNNKSYESRNSPTPVIQDGDGGGQFVQDAVTHALCLQRPFANTHLSHGPCLCTVRSVSV